MTKILSIEKGIQKEHPQLVWGENDTSIIYKVPDMQLLD